MYSVGEKVRATVSPGKTCRAIILYIGSSEEGDPTYDVLVERPSGCFHNKSSTATGQPKDGKKYSESERELTGLTPSEVSPLQPFETDGSLEKSTPSGLAIGELSDFAEGLKDKGNALFKLGDTDAAAKIFASVLRTLARTPAVGATVLVRVRTVDIYDIRYRLGMVSDSNDDGRVSYDVIYDENSPSRKANEDLDAAAEEEDDDEEDGVEADRVVPVSISPCLSCAARLNLARCWFRKGKHNEVVETCTLVMSLAKLAMADKERPREEREKLRAHCLTALRMKGGSHLAQNHVGLARKYARSMVRSAWDTESRAQAARFEARVERKAKTLLRADRKLAKDVTRWVDASMEKHEEARFKGEEGVELPAPPPQGSREEDSVGVEMEHLGVEEAKGGEENGPVKSGLGGWVR